MKKYSCNFKKASKQDLPQIALLAQRIWPEVYKDIISEEQIGFMLKELYATPALETQMRQGQQFVILEINEQPAGFVSYSATEQSGVSKINKLYLLPKFHGKGAGKMLIDYAEKEIAAAGNSAVILNVNRNNKAKDFYLRCGYSITEVVDIEIGPFWMNDFIMRKALA